jgi:hypothetical protein
MMAEPRPWDAEVREDLRARGDQLVVDVESGLSALTARADRIGRRRARARWAGLALTAVTAAVALIVAGPLWHVTETAPSTGPRTIRPAPATGAAEALFGTWQRTVVSASTDALVAGSWSMRLTRTDNGALSLTGPAGGPSTDGVAYSVQADRLRINAFANDACAGLSAGVYRWTALDHTLTLTVVADPCGARTAVFGGSWASGSSG